jgi:indolepyruvate ferredoxin oxidoreductase
VTIGALVGMAAHLDDKGVSVLDMTGLAQKYGAVFSHLRIADRPEAIHAVRIATGEADAIIGGDLVVTASAEALAKMLGGRTRAVVNRTETPTAEFTRDPDWTLPLDKLQTQVADALGHGDHSPRAWFFDAQALATQLLGDAVFTNLLLLGFAWQKGMLPVTHAALQRAIELNGTAVEANRAAFLWGRRAALDLAAVLKLAQPPQVVPLHRLSRSLDEIVARRIEYLTAYQNRAYGERYRRLVERVRQTPGSTPALSEAVARSYFKLLAVKDEYEVARLHSDPAFLAQIDEQFTGDFKLHFHLAPALFSKINPKTGRIGKREYGQWMLTAMRLLAKLKGLRGTPLDVFSYASERRAECALIAEYEADIDLLLQGLAAKTIDTAVALATLPQEIRGYGHIKQESMGKAAQKRRALREKLLTEAKGDAVSWRSAA